MLKNPNVLLLGSVLLIIVAAVFVSILNRTTEPTSQTSDVRAKAALTNSLQMNATVNSTDENTGIVVVDNAYLADESRSGEARSMGTWTVTVPPNFNFASVYPGQKVLISFDATTFLAQNHTVAAFAISPAK